MRSFLAKIIATTLLGIVFLLGGVEMVSATTTPQGVSASDLAILNGSIVPLTSAQPAQPAGWAYNTSTTVGVTTWSIGFTDQTACDIASKAAKGSNCTHSLGVDGAGIGTDGNAAGTKAPYTGPPELKGFNCGISIKDVSVDIMGCLPIGTYYFIYKPVSYLLIGGGYIFDKALDLSTKKEIVSDPPFIDSSWKVIRDFSNMLFIFILLYTGISTMLGAKDWRGVVLKVIVIALLINFSLFFTKVVIDAGNVLAVGVYDTILASGNQNPAPNPPLSPSEKLAKTFEPQKFLDAAKQPHTMDAVIVFIIAALVNGFAAYTFFRAGLLFVGRIIAFWFLMIVSPFAFISTALPKGNIFSFWWGTLLSQAFVAPVYLFLIYLILQIVNVPGGILGNAFAQSKALTAANPDHFIEALIPITLMAVMLVFAMQKSLKLAEGMAGDFGAMGAKMAGSVLGVAGGVALGGTAMLARGAIGRVAADALKRGGTEFGESKMGGVAKWATRQSFDVRNVTLPKFASQGLGSLGVNVGKGGGAGGVEKTATDKNKKNTDNVPKQSIFTEQGVLRRAAKEDIEINKEDGAFHERSVLEIKNTEETLKVSTDEVKKLEEEYKVASEQSDAAVDLKNKEAEYAVAQQRVERDRGTSDEKASLDAMNEAKKALDKATMGQTVALRPLLDALKKAREAQTEAEKAAAEAKKSATTRAGEVLEASNASMRKAYANKIEKGSWITKGDPVAAGKVRNNKDSGHAKKAKELAKELKEAREGGKGDEVIKHIEEKIEKHEGN